MDPTLLQNIFQQVFQLCPDQEMEAMTRDNYAEWDSITHVQLMIKVASAYSVQFAPKDFIECNSYKSILARIEALQTTNQ